MWYATSYRAGGSCYGSWVWARSRREAVRVAVERGIGERILLCPPFRKRQGLRTSEALRSRRKSGDKYHACVWLGFLAASSGVATTVQLLRDDGMIHKAAHAAAGFGNWKELAIVAADLEARIPGYLAPSEGI